MAALGTLWGDGARCEIRDAGLWLGGPLATDELAVGAVGRALIAAADLAHARTGHRPAVALSAQHAALSFQSERHARLRGAPSPPGFAPLSRFVRCAGDGWARTHGNYRHHAAALARALNFPVAGGPESLERAAATITADDLEAVVIAAGGCAAALRTGDEWATHPVGAAAAAVPLIAHDAVLAHESGRALPPLPSGTPVAAPATGLRVIDLTRVIAGPVAGRTLAALGAEVLRVDPPALPEIAAQHLDTGPGKRSATLDLNDAPVREALLAGADVLLCGYRSGSLDRFGLTAAAVAERHPHLVHVSLSAWGTDGPWAQRRGFDSLVQVACGIATLTANADGTPAALPAQALDHATGHLIAAAALDGLSRRARGAPVAPARLSLATTAAVLTALPAAPRADECTGRADAGRYRVAFGDLELIAPPGTLDGVRLRWSHGPRPFGGDAATWQR